MAKIPTIRVKNAGIVMLDRFAKANGGGSLYVRNTKQGHALELPVIGKTKKNGVFPIKRFFFIRDMDSVQAQRANHAHRETKEVVFCVSGSCVIHLDDGTTKQRIHMHDPAVGILHGPGLWHRISNFSKDCVLLAFADTVVYDPSEYIYEYRQFLEHLKISRART
jgi:hypothetical protein